MIRLEKKELGPGYPCFIIAEAGVNHNGDVLSAKRLIDAASDACADAVKFQTFKTENLVTFNAPKAEYQKQYDSPSATQYNMLKKLELTTTDFRMLSEYSKKKGVVFLSTGFDQGSIDTLARLKVPAFKIPSGEITNFPLMKKIARYKKPVILSTGMATLDEIRDAVLFLKKYECKEIILLHCTSCYPAPFESINLHVLNTLRNEFRVPVGYSDHTEGIVIPIAAVALGACVVEKHLTLDRSLSGPDQKSSIEPQEFKRMVIAIRNVETALGDGQKKVELCELDNRYIVRKSIVALKNIPNGSILTAGLLTLKRPGTGIEPKYLTDLIGKMTKCDIKKDTVITWDMME